MLAQHPTEPDEEWKTRLRSDIEKTLSSMVAAAKQNFQTKLAAEPVSAENEYRTAMDNIRQLAEEQFRAAVQRERMERQWASGHAIDENWNDALVKEQQAILDRIEKEKKQGGGMQRSTSGQSTQTSRSVPDSATGPSASLASQVRTSSSMESPTVSTSQSRTISRVWTPKESPGAEPDSYFSRSSSAQESEESKSNIRSGKKRAGSLTSAISSNRPPSIPEQPENATSRPLHPSNTVDAESSRPPRSSIEAPPSVRGDSVRRKISGNSRPILPEFWRPTITPEEDAAQSKAFTMARRSSNESNSSSVHLPSALRPPDRSTDPPAPDTTNIYAERERERGSRQTSDTYGESPSYNERYASRNYTTATPSPTSAISSVHTRTADAVRPFPPSSASRPIVNKRSATVDDGRLQSSPSPKNWITSGRYETSRSPSVFDDGPRSWQSSGLRGKISGLDIRQAESQDRSSRRDRRAVKPGDYSDEDFDEDPKAWRSRRYEDNPPLNGQTPSARRRTEELTQDSKKRDEERRLQEEEERVEKRRRDEEDRIRWEKERKKQDEEERIRRMDERKKQDEEDRLRREEARRRLDEEELARREEDRRKWDEEEQARREVERKRWEAEIAQRDAERSRREEERRKHEEERKAFEEEQHRMAEERQNFVEEDRRRREERKKFQDEEKSRKQEKKKQEEERRKYEAERRRHAEEDRRQREDGKFKQGEFNRLKDEAKRREEEASRLEDLARRKEQELARMEEQMKEAETLANTKMEQAKGLEGQARRREEEAQRREDEVRQREEAAVRMEKEVRQKAEEVQGKEEEVQRKQDRARLLEADLRRREEEIRKREHELEKREEDLAQREAESIQKELDMQMQDEERGKWDKQQEEYRKRAEEAVKRREERKRQDSWENGRSYPSQGSFNSQSSSTPWPIPGQADDTTSTTPPSGTSFTSSSYTARTGSAWSYASTRTSSTATSQTSTAHRSPSASDTRPSTSVPKPSTSNSYATPLSEAEWRRRQAEQAQQREAQFRQEQARLEQERLSKEPSVLSRMDMIRLLDAHRSQWDKLQSRTTLSWDDFPWPMFKRPAGPDDLTATGISAYMLSPLQPTDKTAKDRIREGIRKWHPDRFETQVLWKVKEGDKERVKEGAGSVVRCLNDLLRSSTKDLFS